MKRKQINKNKKNKNEKGREGGGELGITWPKKGIPNMRKKEETRKLYENITIKA